MFARSSSTGREWPHRWPRSTVARSHAPASTYPLPGAPSPSPAPLDLPAIDVPPSPSARSPGRITSRVLGRVLTSTAAAFAATSFGPPALAPAGPSEAGLADASECAPSWPRQLAPARVTNALFLSALARFDLPDGSSAVAIGGNFTLADGEPANRVALLREDGSTTPLGEGFDGQVLAFALLPSERGPMLIAGGSFTLADGAPANRVAAWNGSAWMALGDTVVGGGVDGQVRALAVHDDGSGPSLYAGGTFTSADGVPALRLARWNGRSWSDVGGGVTGTVPGEATISVDSLASHDDGGGPALYVGGAFAMAGGTPAKHLVRLRDGAWSNLGGTLNGSVLALESCVLQGSSVLALGGSFTMLAPGVNSKRVGFWNGSAFTAVTGGPSSTVRALEHAVMDGEPSLVVGGTFTSVDSVASARRIARWNGAAWTRLGSFENGDVRAILAPGPGFGAFPGNDGEHRDATDRVKSGASPTLLAAGTFTDSASRTVDRLARWNGTSWRDLRESVPGFHTNGLIYDVAVVEGAQGSELIVCGGFDHAGGSPSNRVARFRGGRWRDVGSPIVGSPFALHVSTTEPGALYVAGAFEDGDGDSQTVIGLLRLEGETWTPVAHLSRGLGPTPYAYAITEFDDGSGTSLWLGGLFDAVNGVVCSGIAALGDAGWISPDNGLAPFSGSRALALEVFDDGDGPALYVGGEFYGAGDVDSAYVVRWTGTGWEPVGGGKGGGEGGVASTGSVWALRAHDDGTGPTLYAGGFDLGDIGWQWPGLGVHRLVNDAWSQVGQSIFGQVRRLIEWPSPAGPRLVAVGTIWRSWPPAVGPLVWDGEAWELIDDLEFVVGTGPWCGTVSDDGALLVGGSFRGASASNGVIDLQNLALYSASGAPWITAISDDVVVRAGKALTLEVRWAEGGESPTSVVTWRRDSVPIGGGTPGARPTINTLVIDPVDLADVGLYDALLEHECGTVVSAAIAVAVTCAEDLDGDGVVGGGDLGHLLAAWGCSDAMTCADADLNGDGTVDSVDLAIVIAAWGSAAPGCFDSDGGR